MVNETLEQIQETIPPAGVFHDTASEWYTNEYVTGHLHTIDYTNFTTTWLQIRNRLHENSGLQNPKNEIGALLDLTIGVTIEAFEDFIDDHLLQAFILTAEGDHLDRIADEHGLERMNNEDDTSLRQRIFNSIIFSLSIVFVERQGIRNYSKKRLHDDSRLYMTSCNPHTTNLYDTIPVTAIAKAWLYNQLIYEYTCRVHAKGW